MIRRGGGQNDQVKAQGRLCDGLFPGGVPGIRGALKARGQGQGVFRGLQGKVAGGAVTGGNVPGPNPRMGPDPFVTGVNPFGEVVVGKPLRGNRPAGGCYFNTHNFDDKISFFVILL
jgi:hypothetical protein